MASSSSSMIDVGEVVAGRYRILSELGRGGMGAVFVAEDTRFDEKVALKVATASGAAYDDFKQRFMREAGIGSKLGQTAGFVRAFDWGTLEDGRTLYLAMDLIENADELDLVSGSQVERLERLAEASRLVAESHRMGVIHRDLKPANFFQAADGSIWLGDFGLAKIIGEEQEADPVTNASLTQSGMGMGTPYFMPPEQFENVRDVGVGGDVYALGAMLFFLLTQRYPYEGETPGQILSSQMKVKFGQERQPRPSTWNPSVPRELDKLCADATSINPKRRISSADAFLETLRDFIAHGPADAGPSPANAATVDEYRPGAAVGGPVGGRRPSSRPGQIEGLTTTGGPKKKESGVLPVALAVGTFAILGGVFALTRPTIDDAASSSEVAETAKQRPAEWAKLEKKVEKGDVKAMLTLAGLYEAEQDGLKEAFGLYRKAANQGNATAMVSVGKMYDRGDGVDKSEDMAKAWFQKAADAGDERGKLLLAGIVERRSARKLRRERAEAAKAEAESRRLEAKYDTSTKTYTRTHYKRGKYPTRRSKYRWSSRTKRYPRPYREYHTDTCRAKPSCSTPYTCKNAGKAKGYGTTTKKRATASSYDERMVKKYGGRVRKAGEYHTSSCRAHPTCKSYYTCQRSDPRKKRVARKAYRASWHTTACKLRPKCVTPTTCRRNLSNRHKRTKTIYGGTGAASGGTRRPVRKPVRTPYKPYRKKPKRSRVRYR